MTTVGKHPILEGQTALYATKSFAPNAIVLDLSDLKELKTNNKYAITVKRGVYLDTQGNPGQYLNHSCDPNLQFDAETRTFSSTKLIQKDDMLTFDYKTTEPDIAESFNCVCGAKKCQGFIGTL